MAVVRLILGVLLALQVTACAALAQTPPRDTPLKVVATTTHIADFARTIAGDKIQVTSILHANDDPHEYQPTAADARAIADADVVLRHGLTLDQWADKLIDAAGPKPVYTITAGLPLRPGDEQSPDGDPHVWQSPPLAKMMVSNVAAALGEQDPANADAYAASASRYNQRLDRLDSELKAMIEEIPRENRKMVTNHDAFHYYTDHFGLELIGSIIPTTSTEEGVPAGSLGRLIRLIIDRQVNAVFSENTVQTKVAQDIADQTGAKVVSGLVSDSLGEPGSGTDSYEGMMRSNTRIIVDALK
ncbi:MAG TPA: zinc ABC transporter substrate-binding protein [Chloroflexota bacterium]|jgi:ABC-type Zn uptake system ZnuABC Zn-binding protein ZnuA